MPYGVFDDGHQHTPIGIPTVKTRSDSRATIVGVLDGRPPVIKAILFDLDGTLLDIDLEGFLRAYFGLLGPAIERFSDLASADAIAAVMSGTEAMCGSHPGRTNRDVFNDAFHRACGIDLTEATAVDALNTFYAVEFPTLRGSHGPRTGSADVIRAAVEAGVRIAVATNPIFPLDAVTERMRWAELEPDTFDLVTSYETSEACKPLPLYYRGIASSLQVQPSECLMVGDDPVLDLAAADVGMRTFYVGEGSPPTADWSGDLIDLAGLISRVTG